MEVTLADIIEPTVYNDYQMEFTAELNEFMDSGVVTMSDMFSTAVRAADGFVVHHPKWEDLFTTGVGDSANRDSTGGADAVPANIGSHEEIAVKNFRNQHWEAADLSSVVAGSDPMTVIAQGTARYWSREWQTTLLAIFNGIIAQDLAGAGELGVNVYADVDLGAAGTQVPVADPTQLTATVIIDAQTTAGDAGPNQFAAIAMRSRQYGSLRKQNLIDFIPNARGEVLFAFFMGMRVIVDDGMLNLGGANEDQIVTILFAPGVVSFGMGEPRTPLEVDRYPLKFQGGGSEVLSSRQHYSFHPKRYSYAGAQTIGPVATGQSPDNPTFRTAGTYNRVSTDRRHVNWAYVSHNDSVAR